MEEKLRFLPFQYKFGVLGFCESMTPQFFVESMRFCSTAIFGIESMENFMIMDSACTWPLILILSKTQLLWVFSLRPETFLLKTTQRERVIYAKYRFLKWKNEIFFSVPIVGFKSARELKWLTEQRWVSRGFEGAPSWNRVILKIPGKILFSQFLCVSWHTESITEVVKIHEILLWSLASKRLMKFCIDGLDPF